MKPINKLFTLLTVLVLSLSVMTVPAFAENTVSGTDTITFDKYLTINEEAHVPNTSFTFEIKSGTAVDAVTTDPKTPAVMAGPAGAKLTYGDQNSNVVTVAFTSDDTTYNTVQDGDTVELDTGYKYAKKTVKVDLTGVTFTEPGIYRYEITESGIDNAVYYDAVKTRYLDIYINSDNDGNLSVQGSIMHNTTEVMAAAGGVYTEKDGGFTNKYPAYKLTFSKEVTGNQGFRGKYFTFTVDIKNATPNTKYAVDLTDASTNDGKGNTNPTTLTADADGNVTGTFYLKDGESIIIYGFIETTKYTVSENAEDYTPSYKLDQAAVVAGSSTPEDATMGKFDHSVVFTNDRSGVVPTGILVDIAPYALIVLLAGAAGILMILKKRKHTTR